MCLAVLKLVYSYRGAGLIGTSYRYAHVRKGITIYTGIGNRFFSKFVIWKMCNLVIANKGKHVLCMYFPKNWRLWEGCGGHNFIFVNMTLLFVFVLKKFKPFIQMSKREFLSLPSYRINATLNPEWKKKNIKLIWMIKLDFKAHKT